VFLRIRSSIPGRLRLEAPSLVGDAHLGSVLQTRLQAASGIYSCAANPVTGGILVTYAPSLDSSEVIQMVNTHLEDAVEHRGEADLTYRPWSPAPGENPFISFLNHSPQHSGLIAGALGTAFADRMFEAAPPAMIGAGVDVLTRGSNSVIGKLGFPTVPSQLSFLGLAASAVWILDSFLGYLHTLSSERLAIAVQNDLRNQIYRHLQILDLAIIEERPVSAWMSLLEGDLSRIGKFIAQGVDPIVTIAANCVIVLSTLFVSSPALALVHIAVGPLIYLVSRGLLKAILKRYERMGKDESRLMEILHGNMTGMATIASFTQQENEAARVALAGDKWAESTRSTANVSAFYTPAIQLAVGAGFLSTLTWGGILVSRGEVETGAYNSMGLASLRLLAALGRLGMSIEQYQRASVSMKRVISILERKPLVASGSGTLSQQAAKSDIVFDNVHYEYVAGTPVLCGVSMTFPGGKTSALVGPTGAGKTTALKLLLRFYDPTGGSIRIGGIATRDLQLDSLRSHLALVPQSTFLFGGTVRENIAYAKPDASAEEVREAARVARADTFIEQLPNGYDTVLSERGVQLSGGQQQRIAIARAVLSDRSILLFDEATSAVDFETEASIQSSLKEAAHGRTIVLIAHRLSTVRNADVIYVMDDGRVIEQGRHDELIQANGLYATLWRIQTGETSKESGQESEPAASTAAAPVEPEPAEPEPEEPAPAPTPSASELVHIPPAEPEAGETESESIETKPGLARPQEPEPEPEQSQPEQPAPLPPEPEQPPVVAQSIAAPVIQPAVHPKPRIQSRAKTPSPGKPLPAAKVQPAAEHQPAKAPAKSQPAPKTRSAAAVPPASKAPATSIVPPATSASPATAAPPAARTRKAPNRALAQRKTPKSTKE